MSQLQLTGIAPIVVTFAAGQAQISLAGSAPVGPNGESLQSGMLSELITVAAAAVSWSIADLLPAGAGGPDRPPQRPIGVAKATPNLLPGAPSALPSRSPGKSHGQTTMGPSSVTIGTGDGFPKSQ